MYKTRGRLRQTVRVKNRSKGERECEMFLIFCLCFSIAATGLFIVRLVQIKKLYNKNGHEVSEVIISRKVPIVIAFIVIPLTFAYGVYIWFTEAIYSAPIVSINSIGLAAILVNNIYGGLKKECSENHGKEND